MRTTSIFAAVALAFAVTGASTADLTSSIAAAVAEPSRPATDTATDTNRKPLETLTFSGIRPGMVVGEFYPGGGYFTRMLSAVVGPRGHVYGLENAGWKGAVTADQGVKLPNVTIDAKPFGTVRFPKPLDLAWVTQNYHDLKIAEFGKVDTAAFNRAVFAALKPGGLYFILDHEASAGTTVAAIAKLHRIEKAQVIREVTAAGFKLQAEGSFLHRAEDDHSLPIFDKQIQGRTDQYALRFVKPPAR